MKKIEKLHPFFFFKFVANIFIYKASFFVYLNIENLRHSDLFS